jgi:hypothetical protein
VSVPFHRPPDPAAIGPIARFSLLITCGRPAKMSASLMPRSDSFNARVRGSSHIDFKTATTGVAAKSMRNELSKLVGTVEDPQTKKVRAPPIVLCATRHRS